ncbi:MAG: hypothetical protein GC205_10785 [Bacteroidetes bacterium]|nr:hypothetical protein [Bacteroidota bacterium]
MNPPPQPTAIFAFLPALLFWSLLLTIPTECNAQTGLKVGLSAGYALQHSQIPPAIADPTLEVRPGQNAFVGLDLHFPLSDDAELRTGFRLRNQTTVVVWNQPGSAQRQQNDFSVVELPLGFGLKRALGQRWTIGQVYALEMQVLGSGSAAEPVPPSGPVFQVLAQPQRHVQAAVSVQAELGYCTRANFCLDLQVSYHQGIAGTQQVAVAVLRNPDQNWVYPMTQSGSYFSTGLAFSLPAGRIGRKPEADSAL